MAAKNYTEILELVNAGNQMGLSNTIKRDYGIPLDFTSVQASYDDAVVYAATNTKAYVGQPLSVGGKLYIINDVAGEAKHKVGEVEYDNYLVEVGSATEGDGVTIDLEEGVLTLHGFESALTGYLPRKAEDGSLEWVPISAVVQGDGNKVTTLTSEDGSVVITKKTDTDESLVYDLSVVHPDAPEYAIAADTRAEGATETTYHLTKDGENVEVAIVVPDAYDDTALADRVSDVETAVETTIPGLINDVDAKFADYTKTTDLPTDLGDFGNEAGYAKTADVNTELAKKANKADYDQTVLDLDALEAKVDAFLSGTGAEGALDSLQELITYINTHDDADINGILASIQAIEDKLVLGTHEVDGETKEYATVKAYVEAVIEALNVAQYAKASDLESVAGRVKVLEEKPFDTYATKDEVNAARTGAVEDVSKVGYALEANVVNTYATKQELNTLDGKLASYYTKTETDGLLNGKVDEAQLENYYTKTETVAKTEVYTKGQIDQMLEDIEGGSTESAASVKRALDAYIQDVDTEIYGANLVVEWTAEDGTYTPDYLNSTSRIDTALANAATAQAQANKGVADATAAQGTANAAAAQAEQNKTDIASHLTRIGALETAKAGHETRIAGLEGLVGHEASEGVEASGLVKATLDNAAAIGTINGTIAALDAAYKAKDEELVALINAKANSADVYKKSETYSATEIDDKIGAVAGTIDFTPYLKKDDAAVTYATIAALEGIYKAGEGEAEATGVLAEEIARAKAAESKNATDIAALDATLKAAIENEGEGLDSIKELALWIEEHESDILPILSGFGGTDEPANIKTYVDESIAAIPAYELPAATAAALGGIKSAADVDGKVAVNKVYVDADGNAEVKAFSTDNLVQGIKTLILNGGSAKA